MLWANGATLLPLGTNHLGRRQHRRHRRRPQMGQGQCFGYAATAIEHSDEVFQDMKRGIVGGDPGSNYGWNDAEVSIICSKFIRNSEAGVSVESYNALNYWIWDSEFTDNARGATNTFCCGNFHVYRSVFRNSSIADIHIRDTSHFSFRGNTSIGSNRFLLADYIGQNTAAITLQDNKILDTVQADAISDNNVGPLFLIDNVIRSRSGASGPAVTMDTGWATGPDLVSVGNKFTVAAPISVKNEGERALVGARRSSRSLRQHRRHHSNASRHARQHEPRVFEIAPGANSAEIQQAIDQAATLFGQRPVVHFPKGSYSSARRSRYPPMPTYRLLAMAGTADCLDRRRRRDHSAAQWPEQGDLARVQVQCGQGGNRATGIAIENADQPGARVYLEGFVTGLRFKPRCLRTA